MARVKHQRKSESADEWLDSLGYYRKPIAKDGSCLFRAVSEQVFDTQIHHIKVRHAAIEFMGNHREIFEDSVDGYYDNYLCCLRNPKEWGGRLEMNAMSLMYRKEFIVFNNEDKLQCQITNNNFEDKILLFCIDSKHYDNVYPKFYLEAAALCQSIVYDLLYKKVFNLGTEVDYAVEKMLHDKEYAKQRKDSTASYDGTFDKSSSPSPDFLLEPPEVEIEELDDGVESSEIRRALARGFPPFPYKVAKALDPDIYRNVELDVWNEQKRRVLYEPGSKCLVRNDKDKNEMYNAHVQEIDTDNKTVTVYIEELGEKKTLGIESLEPLPTSPQKAQHWSVAAKPFKPCGYYQKGMKSPVLDYDQAKSKKKGKKKMDMPSFTLSSVFSSRSQYDSSAVTFNRGRASPPVVSVNSSYNRFRPKNNLGARHQGTIHNQQTSPEQENGQKRHPEKEMFEFQDHQDLSAFPALPKSQVTNQSTSSQANGVWGRNSRNINNHLNTQNGNGRQSNLEKQMQKDICKNSVPLTSTPPIPISAPHNPNPNVSLTSCNVLSTVSPNSPPFEPSPISLSLSSPVLSQELNPQMNCSMAMQQPAQMVNQTPPPTYGYVQYSQMYPGTTVVPFGDLPSQAINFNVARSQDPNGNDLPLNDLPTLRYFFNLGCDYFRMTSIYPPVQQQQPYTVWNYGTPIGYSPVTSFTPPPTYASDPTDALEEPANGNGQCSSTGDQGVRLDDQQLDAIDDIYDLTAEYANMYITPSLVTDFKNNVVLEPKQNLFSVTPDHMIYSPFTGNYGTTYDMQLPPIPSSAPWGCSPHESVPLPHTTRRPPLHSMFNRANLHPQRGNNLPPRFQRRNSNGNGAQRKDRSRYEGQPLLHVARNPPENLGVSENETNSEEGYYHQSSSPTSTPAILASTPPAIYYSQPQYVYHQPPPQPIPQQMSFMPAAVQ